MVEKHIYGSAKILRSWHEVEPLNPRIEPRRPITADLYMTTGSEDEFSGNLLGVYWFMCYGL